MNAQDTEFLDWLSFGSCLQKEATEERKLESVPDILLLLSKFECRQLVHVLSSASIW